MPRGRKGRAATHGDAENFRLRKNKQFDKSRQDIAIETIFGSRILSIVRPTVKFSLSTCYIIDICSEFLNTLRWTCGVTIVEEDLKHLVIVTVMQMEAKVWFAQQSTAFAHFGEEVEQRAQRVKVVLPEALYPLSFYLDQIGKIEIDHQVMVPVIHDLCYRTLGQYAPHLNIALMPPGWIELPAGNALTGARQWVEIINERACLEAKIIVRDGNIIAFNQEFLADSNGYPWLGLIRLHPSRDVLPEDRKSVV